MRNYTFLKVKEDFVFRTKIVNDLPGLTETVNTETDLFQRRLELLLKTCWSLQNSKIENHDITGNGDD